jgi:Tfp pilus assembly protein PilN
MIIRSNLSSNPARNYSLYFIGCVLLFIGAIAFTVFNVTSLSRWFVESRQLQARMSEQQLKIADLQRQGTELEARIAKIKTPQFVLQTEFVNDAIKRRVFSWTTLFDQFEGVLPDNVKMVSVFPKFGDQQITITMEVAGKSLNDIVSLIQAFWNSPAFSDVVLKGERQESDGLLHATISLRYLPEKVEEAKVAPGKQTVTHVTDQDAEETEAEEE